MHPCANYSMFILYKAGAASGAYFTSSAKIILQPTIKHLFIDRLPPIIGTGGIVRLLIEVDKCNQNHSGEITLSGGLAIIGISDGRASRLKRLLDSHPPGAGCGFAWLNSFVDQQPPRSLPVKIQ